MNKRSCRKYVELYEDYNRFVEICLSFVIYRSGVMRKVGLMTNLSYLFNNFREGVKSVFLPYLGISDRNVFIIDNHVNSDAKISRFYKVYSSKHQIAALADYVLEKMPDSDFDALNEIHKIRANQLKSFNSVPSKIKGIFLVISALVVGSAYTSYWSIFGVDQQTFAPLVIYLISTLILATIPTFLIFFIAYVKTSPTRSVAGEVLAIIAIQSKCEMQKSTNVKNVESEQSVDPVI